MATTNDDGLEEIPEEWPYTLAKAGPPVDLQWTATEAASAIMERCSVEHIAKSEDPPQHMAEILCQEIDAALQIVSEAYEEKLGRTYDALADLEEILEVTRETLEIEQTQVAMYEARFRGVTQH